MYTEEFQLGTGRDNGDIFHTNTLEVLDGRIAAQAPAFASGRVLVSLRVPSVLAIVDLEDERVVWARKGDYRRQHDPKIIANGNLLLFDNVGLRNKSRVLEIDPTTDETLWSYSGTQDDPFLTRACGAAQRLPNGNTLITETNNGRAFEITKSGEIVWEFTSLSQ